MIHHRNWPTIIGYTIAGITFVVAASYGVLYATGYRLNVETWQLQKTGVLAVTSRPAGASVTVSGKKYPKTTPLALRNVLPGEYMVEVNGEGYRPYHETVQVKPGFATEISGVDLVLTQPEQIAIGLDGQPDKAIRAVSSGNETIYWSGNKKWYRVEETKPIELNFDRIPAHVKTALTTAADVAFIEKHAGSSTIITSLTASGKKWLAVVDPNGFRGSLFGAPLNQAAPENIKMIDNDRLVALIGTTLYTLDLNASKLVTYAKNITSFSWIEGKGYIFAKDATGKPTLQIDANLFDEKPAENQSWPLPTGKTHSVIATRDNWSLIQTGSGTTAGLWLIETLQTAGELTYKQYVISSDAHGVTIDYDKKQFIYISGNRLMNYDLATHTEKMLRNFERTPATLLGRRNNSLFIQTDKELAIVNPTGENYYELAAGQPKLLLGDDSRKFWLLDKDVLTEWIVRKNTGLFGVLGSRFGGQKPT
jgi:hypothetical protein